MNGKERGFLLLASQLGDPNSRPLTPAQLRSLSDRVRGMDRPEEDRELVFADLTALGYREDMACRILSLLEREELLEHYLSRGRKLGCEPLTRVSPGYPGILRDRLGPEAPGCLWAKGDLTLLETPMVALVGSRDLLEQNKGFAREVGRQAAYQGYTLVSGNARGADRAAQEACLQAGGRVISVVPDRLVKQPQRRNLLYLSQDGFDEEFSAQRALSRNRVIHALGQCVFVAQCGYQTGGTWDGTVKNLRFHWSPVRCFDDGSPAVAMLAQMGAERIGWEQLSDIEALTTGERTLFDPLSWNNMNRGHPGT